ncbi:hypothetical protein ACPA54_37905 [Uniformispora flossi]|uniref:hypothetical protein n=1 Tax=Uniformispora flossi TaxID=3390723 RepID=UPI003C2E3B7A
MRPDTAAKRCGPFTVDESTSLWAQVSQYWGMPSSLPEEITATADAISIMHTGTVEAEYAKAAHEAMASLCSGAGHALLYAPDEIRKLVEQAIEVGYAAALKDVAAGRFDDEVRQWRPGLCEQ